MSEEKGKGRLTSRQELFCNEYIVDFNAKQAPIRAGYSKNSATEIGYDCLRLPHVSERIADLQSERMLRVKIDADYVLNRLKSIDEMDLIDILTEDMALKPISEWPEVWRRTLTAIDIQTIGKGGDAIGIMSKIKWPDKVKNLELLGRHINVRAFKDNLDLTNSDETLKPTLVTLTDKQFNKISSSLDDDY